MVKWPFQRLSTSRPFNAPFVHFRATVAAHLAVSRKYFASGLPSANGWVLVPKQWCWSLATIDQSWSNKTCKFALCIFSVVCFGFHQLVFQRHVGFGFGCRVVSPTSERWNHGFIDFDFWPSSEFEVDQDPSLLIDLKLTEKMDLLIF